MSEMSPKQPSSGNFGTILREQRKRKNEKFFPR